MNSIVDLLSEKSGVSREGGGFVQGIVTDNADKEHAGMVKVEFTAWKQGENIHEWIPLLRPYAGAEYGRYWVPEVGDIVLVGFIGSGFRRPFVLGSFSPAGAALDSGAFNEKNYIKRLRTKGGTEVTFSDEDKKQSVQVKTAKGLTLFIEDESEKITLGDQGNKNTLTIDAKQGTVTLQAEKKLVLSCGGCKIELNGSSGSYSLSGNSFTLEGKQTGSIKGGQALSAEGGVFKAEGGQTLSLKGGALTQIEGGMVKIN